MGTRSLIMVINKKGETKIAQYCQFDGYPSGQGLVVLSFLLNSKLEEFQNKIEHCYFVDEESEESEHLEVTFGSRILRYVYENANENNKIYLINDSNFAYNSLFCEWVYVIDFSKNTFEIYEGFQTEKLEPHERFYKEDPDEFGHYGVKMMDSYSLNELPTVKDFLYYTTTDEGLYERNKIKKIKRL